MGKVVFGLSRTHYAKYTEGTGGEAGTYATPVEAHGAVSITLDIEGENQDFWADNTKYATFSNNGGYTGTIEMAYGKDQMLIDLLGFEYDDNHVLIERADAQPSKFALLFEVESNVSPDRFVFYDVVMGRPGNTANTKTDSTNPDTQSFPITVVPHEFSYGGDLVPIVKGRVSNEGDQAASYASWFSQVKVPAKASA